MRLAKLKIAAGAGAAILAAAWMIHAARARCLPVSGVSAVTVSITSLLRGGAQTYCYTDPAGRRLRFILARGTDGKVRSVFDACRQCFTYHSGFKISHDQLICRVCGNHYPIEHMAEGKASCVPAGLPHQEARGTITIRTSDLESGRYLF
ncbi:MAG TPA: Fe-S-containing protein [Candidatus Binataceae bacterium]|nr:Fe-S-containing protein [Candidatus Binataceae bacterium]